MAKKLQVSIGVNTKGYKADWDEVQKATKQATDNVGRQTSNATTSMNGMFKQLAKNSLGARSAFIQVAEGVTGMSLGFGAATLAAKGLTVAFDAMFGDFIRANSAFKAVPKDIDQLGLRMILKDMDAVMSKNNELLKSQQSIRNAYENGAASVQKEANSVQLYYKIATNLNQSYENRHNSLLQLQKLAPEYFNNFTTETILTDKATEAYKAYNKEAMQRVQMAGLMAMANKTGEEQARAMLNVQSELGKFGKKGKEIADSLDFSGEIGKGKGNLVMAFLNTLGEDDPRKEQILSAIDEFNFYQKQIGNIVDEISKTGVNVEAPKTKSGTPKKTLTEGQKNIAQGFEIDKQTTLESQDKLLGKFSDTIIDTSGAVDKLNTNLDEFSVESSKAALAQYKVADAVNANKQKLKELKTHYDSVNAAANATSAGIISVFDTMGQSIISGLDEAASGTEKFIAQMKALAIKLIGIALAESVANSIKGATQTGTSTGPLAAFTTPAFITAAIGGTFAAFSQIPKFEHGGVVGGTSFSGDRMLARVNSGEVILNTGQQNQLLRLASGNVNTGNIYAETVVKGNDLRIILKNTQTDFKR